MKKYICNLCGTEFDYRTTRGTKFCSKICQNKSISIRFTGKGNPRFNNGWRQYITIKNDITRCENCGRKYNLEVHHKDGNRKNNNLFNLIKVCRRCHMLLDGRFKNLNYHNSGTGLCSPEEVMPND